MNTTKMIKLGVMAALVSATPVLLNSCASGYAIRTGAEVAPTSVESVQMLLESPKRSYESLGLVESKMPDALFLSEQKMAKKAMGELRKQAATLGADAVILKNTTTTSRPDVIINGDDDFAGIFDTDIKRMSGIAIRYK